MDLLVIYANLGDKFHLPAMNGAVLDVARIPDPCQSFCGIEGPTFTLYHSLGVSAADPKAQEYAPEGDYCPVCYEHQMRVRALISAVKRIDLKALGQRAPGQGNNPYSPWPDHLLK